jgi:hypothetical protein
MGRLSWMAGLMFAAAALFAGGASAQDAALTTPPGNDSSSTSPPSSDESSSSATSDTAPATTTQQDGAAASAPTQNQQASPKKGPGNGKPGADGGGNATSDDPKAGNIHTLANNVSITLSTNWAEAETDGLPPPRDLRNYAPPFHLSAVLALQNVKSQSVLQIAMSDNPLLSRDSSWLDEQMHKPAGSGMSVLDMLFYYFFPPSDDCMAEAQNSVVTATFAPSPAIESAEATGAPRPSTDGTNPQLQLTYHCRHEATLDSFYSDQLSNGIVFVQTNSGPRAYSVVPQFYLAPMERVQGPGISWYVFEAQRTEPIPPNASSRFRLPIADGAQPDYFWAIGAPDPFPWTADVGPWAHQLIQVAYVSLSMNNNRRGEFISLVQRIRVRGVNGVQ